MHVSAVSSIDYISCPLSNLILYCHPSLIKCIMHAMPCFTACMGSFHGYNVTELCSEGGKSRSPIICTNTIVTDRVLSAVVATYISKGNSTIKIFVLYCDKCSIKMKLLPSYIKSQDTNCHVEQFREPVTWQEM